LRSAVLIFVAVLVGATVAILPAGAAPRSGEMITWGNFQYVQSVGVSTSHVYFATTNGIVRYNKLEQHWELPLTGADGLGDLEVKKLWATRFDDHLYVQTSIGYYEYDAFFDRWYQRSDLPPLDTIYSQVTIPTNLIPPEGFNYFSTGQLADMAGRSAPISTAVQDNTGDLWIGTWGYGPAHTQGGALEMQLLTCGLLQNQVSALARQDSTLFVSGLYTGGSRNGVTEFHLNDYGSDFIEAGISQNFPLTDVLSLAADESRLYVGTPNGLLLVDRGSGQMIRRIDHRSGLADDSVIALTRRSDSLFIGTASGVSMLRGDSIRLIAPKSLHGHHIYHLESQGAYLWLATDFGAYRLNTVTGEIGEYLDPGRFTAGRVYDIRTSGHFLWMSADNGLLKIDLKTTRSEAIRLSLLPNVRRPMAVNDEIAAVISDHGFILIHHNLPKTITREFTLDDGLPSIQLNCLLIDGDYIWIGSDGGLTRFWWNNPDRVD
jgi:ligand-binding sensor domain-containing protein